MKVTIIKTIQNEEAISILWYENPQKSWGFPFLYSDHVEFIFRLHSSLGICMIMYILGWLLCA